ncbi:STB5 protein [Dendryphion nanum]|uniref:STB5 protein n=1 Tax=Dendryphion nanum TaxID=256645 RepID=A0A9P9EKU0_9PLEO|nr:STB5 protein [Dendryphion nanum]
MRSNVHRFRLQKSPSIREQDVEPKVPRDIPACERCRQFKKRCSRTFPVCTLCAHAGHPCSFSVRVEANDVQTHHLKARVEWLSQFLNEHILSNTTASVDSIDTGSDLKSILGDVLPLASAAGANIHELVPDCSPIDISDHQSFETSERQPSHDSPVSGHELRPDVSTARVFVDAYFQHVNRAYPFVNRAKILQELENLGHASPKIRNDDSTLLSLVVSIGYTTLQRAGKLPINFVSPVPVEYADMINYCFAPERIESIQILVLLAIHSFFDPLGSSAWSVVGMASRQTMMLGLSRRASSAKTGSAVDVELRYRLYWSIYVLDRMTAFCFGLPCTLTDNNADIPLPGLMIEEFASSERSQYASMLQTNRHVIQLRKIESRIMSEIHHRKNSEITRLSHGDRRIITQEIRSDIDTWYSNGSLVSPQTMDNVGIHDSIIWSSARYYHLLLMLHYPCPFNSFDSGVSAAELLRFAQKHLQSTSALLQGRQLPLNWPTLSRLLPVGLVLVHASISSAAHDSHFSANDELSIIASIFDAFPDPWIYAHRASSIFRNFISMISSYAPLFFSSTVFTNGQIGGSKDSIVALFSPLINNLVLLMEEVLGKGTSYIFHELPEEKNEHDISMLSRNQHTSFAPLWHPPNSTTGSISSNDGTADFDWGSMGLGFL